MGIMDTFKSMFGRSDAGAVVQEDVPPVSELLAPSKVMEDIWRRSSRDNAHDLVNVTRADIGREYGARWFPEPLPGDHESRVPAIEERLMARSRGLYAEHVEEVQKMFDLPDAEVRRSLSDVEDLPGRDRPEDRALAISHAILNEQAAEDRMDMQARERQSEYRMSPPGLSDWQEHKAGEPAILAAERDGDWDEVERGRRAYADSFQLKDPTLHEIAITAVENADRWSMLQARDLTSGQVTLSEEAARRVTSSAATYEPGSRRDGALVEAYLEDHAARNPQAVEQWNRQALEVMAEGPAFMQARYGNVETAGMSVRQIVSLEAMRAVRMIRIDQEIDRHIEIVTARDVARPDVAFRAPQAHGMAPAMAVAGAGQGRSV